MNNVGADIDFVACIDDALVDCLVPCVDSSLSEFDAVMKVGCVCFGFCEFKATLTFKKFFCRVVFQGGAPGRWS